MAAGCHGIAAVAPASYRQLAIYAMAESAVDEWRRREYGVGSVENGRRFI